MPTHPDDISPRTPDPPEAPAEPHSPPIYLSSVYRCRDPRQAENLLTGQEPGFVYARDGHPNAQMLSESCRRLHGAERAAITATGMAAISLVVLSHLEQGDHVVVSARLYGASLSLLTVETARLGVTSTVVDTCDLPAVQRALRPETRLLVAETITNPGLRVSNIAGLAEIASRNGTLLLFDNSFASPAVCRPLQHGADLVMESLTKIINGHSDVVLGMLCGSDRVWQRIPMVLSQCSPMDCWLAQRGLSTLSLRAKQASSNALVVAGYLHDDPRAEQVMYPGLPSHPDHALAASQFDGLYGSVVTFTLPGGGGAAERFIAAVSQEIVFCPSLGELSTTLSHPVSTSHRQLSEAQRAQLGITGGTIRLSVGIEAADSIIATLRKGLEAAG